MTTQNRPDGPVATILAGVGGYGTMYLRALAEEQKLGRVQVVGLVDPHPPEDNPDYQQLVDQGAHTNTSFDSLLKNTKAELVCISAPAHLHRSLTERALQAGCHVLCEKPAAPTVADVDAMIAARDKYKKHVAIGFQWCFAPEIIELKRRILTGDFGLPRRARALIMWPRSHRYYSRNSWAGRMRMPDGTIILDSPVANAHAHYLLNLLFMLGDKMDTAAECVAVTAETYRANQIENFDTAIARFATRNAGEIMVFSTHATSPTQGQYGPHLSFEFEQATIQRVLSPDDEHAPWTIQHKNGHIETISHVEDHGLKIRLMPDIIRHNAVHFSSLEAAREHVRCVNAIQDCQPEPAPLPQIVTSQHEGTSWTWAEGLEQDLKRCFDQGALPSEMDCSWATNPGSIQLDCL